MISSSDDLYGTASMDGDCGCDDCTLLGHKDESGCESDIQNQLSAMSLNIDTDTDDCPLGPYIR